MPTLPICDSAGRLLPDAGVRLFAIMLFPDSTDRQRQQYLDAVAQEMIRRGAKFSSEMVAQLRQCPSRPEMRRLVNERFKWGAMVGGIFITILQIAHSFPNTPRASANTVMEYFDKKLNGKARVASKRTMETRWETMKNVRHLWAAFVARDGQFNVLSHIPGLCDGYTLEDDLGAFLTEGAGALLAGDYRPPSAAKKAAPLIDSRTAWTMPAGWTPPPVPEPFGAFRFPRLAASFLGEIDALSAAQSSRPHRPRK